MRGEFEAAMDAGKPLAFAAGCLVAAWREMPRHEEGRFVLANYALALGVIVPMAALQFACAAGLPLPFPAADGFDALDGAQKLWVSGTYLAAEPTLLGLWLWLCILHFRLAWVLLERDWPRVIRTGSCCAAVTVALVIFSGVMLLADSRTILQTAALAVELMAVAASARWHAEMTGTVISGSSLVAS